MNLCCVCVLLALAAIAPAHSAQQLPTSKVGMACSLDLQSGFKDEVVSVFVGTSNVWSGRVTTNPVIGRAAHISLPATDKAFPLRIVFHSSTQKFDKTIDPTMGTFLGLSKTPSQHRPILIQQKKAFFYD